MFERFTDRARQVAVRAQEEARRLDHDYVGPEQVLLGLTHESVGGVAARVLESLGIGLEAARQQESRAPGHRYIGTKHILLGLIRAGDSVAAQVLTELGANLNGAREQVIQVLDQHRREHGHGTA